MGMSPTSMPMFSRIWKYPHTHDAHDDDRAEKIGGIARNANTRHDKPEIEREQKKRTHETELFSEHAEYEVGRCFRQEAERRLRCLHEAFAEEATRADSDLRSGAASYNHRQKGRSSSP